MRAYKSAASSQKRGSVVQSELLPRRPVREAFEEEHHEKEGDGEGTWIYSFADLIMNLLMFFVMLFAISKIDKNKIKEIEQAFSAYTKKDVKREEVAAGASSAAVTHALDLSAAAKTESLELSNSEILAKAKALLEKIDKQELERSSMDKKEMAALLLRLKEIESSTSFRLSKAEDNQNFEIVLGKSSLFANGVGADGNYRFSTSGNRVLSQLENELAHTGAKIKIDIRASLSSTSATPVPVNVKFAYLKTVLDHFQRSDLRKNAIFGFSGFTQNETKKESQLVKNQDAIVLVISPQPVEGGT